MKFDPKLTIETDRLVLRPLRIEDKHSIFLNINNDKEVVKYFITKYCESESEMTLDKTIKYCLENELYLFAIELKDTHEVMGMMIECSGPSTYFNVAEIGFAIGQKYWNHGYVSEATKAMIKLLFDSGVHKVVASHIVENIASKRVLEKCGMIFEGIRKDDVFYHDRYWDLGYYYLINPIK